MTYGLCLRWQEKIGTCMLMMMLENHLLTPGSSVMLEAKIDGKLLLWIQGSDFAPKAIDIAVKELIAVASPGEGCTLTDLNYISFCWIQFVNGFNLWRLFMNVSLVHFFLGYHACKFLNFSAFHSCSWWSTAKPRKTINKISHFDEFRIQSMQYCHLTFFQTHCSFFHMNMSILYSLSGLSLQMVVSEDIGKQILTYGERCVH